MRNCSLIHTDTGPAIVCTSGHPRPKTCRHCSAVSTLLCDYPTRDGGTCSAPICKACALHGGPELDYCKDHRRLVFLTPNGGRIIVANMGELGHDAGHRVDRGHSALANPFKLNSETSRPECLERYRKWLWSKLQESPDGIEEIELVWLANESLQRDLILLCHCAPKLCHAQVVARAILWDLNGRPAPKGAKG